MAQHKKIDNYSTKLFRDEVALCIRRLYEEGLLANEKMGDVSVRDPITGNIFMSLKPGQFNVGEPINYHGCDMVVCDADGNVLSFDTEVSDMLPMHVAIYKARPDVNAIAHTYPPFTAVFAQKKEKLPFVLNEQRSTLVSSSFVSVEPSMTDEYYAEIVKGLGEGFFTTMYNFGAISVGENVDKVINNLVWMNCSCEKIILAQMLKGKLEELYQYLAFEPKDIVE